MHAIDELLTRYHPLQAGQSQPVWLLLHGFTGSQASWDTLTERMAPWARVVRVNLPGHGSHQITRPDEADISRTADELQVIMQHLGYPHYGVLGYSMGGRVALHLARQYPQAVSRLILESASPGIADPTEREARRQSDARLAQNIRERGILWFVDYWSSQPLFAHQPEDVRHQENQIRRQQSPEGLAWSLEAAGAGSQQSLWPDLPRLAMPIRLVVGERDAKYVGLARQMVQQLPQASLTVIPGAGHTVHLEQPDRFWQAIKDFVVITGTIPNPHS